MEMSLKYLEETVEHLSRGFEVEKTEHTEHDEDGAVVYHATRFDLRRPSELFKLECLRYAGGEESYWLEIAEFHGLTTFSFQVDSWKHRPDRVEFKYYAMPDGRGLSFVLSLTERFDADVAD